MLKYIGKSNAKVMASEFGELVFDEKGITKDVTKAQAEQLAKKIPAEFELVAQATKANTTQKSTTAKPKTTAKKETEAPKDK